MILKAIGLAAAIGAGTFVAVKATSTVPITREASASVAFPQDPGLSTVYRHLALRPLQVGDTIVPTYSIATDTVLGVVGYSGKARKCGVGRWFFRLKVRDTVIHADSVSLPVCSDQWEVAGGSTSKTWEQMKCGVNSADPEVAKHIPPCSLPVAAYDTLQIKNLTMCNWQRVITSTQVATAPAKVDSTMQCFDKT